jgi:Beta-propeller repeat
MSPVTNFRRYLACVLMCLLVMTGLISIATRQSHASNNSITHSFPPFMNESSGETTAPEADTVDEAKRSRVSETLGKLPMSFEANQGQHNARVKFLARGNGYSLFLTPSEAVLSLNRPATQETGAAYPAAPSVTHRGDQTGITGHRSAQRDALRMKLVDANPMLHVTGLEESPGKSNYFIGNDPKQWHTNIAHYARVKYESVYRGVDLIYYGNQQQLEYDFIVAPGADPSAIRLAFEGTRGIEIDARGELILRTQGGEVRQRKPFIYQETGGERREVAGRYVKSGKHQVGFEIGAYDPTRPLVIDPVLLYSTYLGGSGDDDGFDIAVDAAGNAYVTGYTLSSGFPTTAGAFDTSYNGGPGGDAFVTKLNANGSALVYSTFLGGSESDEGHGIAVDAAGNAYVTGFTLSTNYPTTPGAFDTSYGGAPSDAFVTKLDASGSTLVYSTFLGGSGGS